MMTPPRLTWPSPIVMTTVKRPATMQDAVVEITDRYHGAILNARSIDNINAEIQATAEYYPERRSNWWAVRSSRYYSGIFIARWHVAISLFVRLWCAARYGVW